MKTFYAVLCRHLFFVAPVVHAVAQRELAGPATALTLEPSYWRDRRGRTVKMPENFLLRQVAVQGFGPTLRLYGYVYAVYTDPAQWPQQQFPWSFEGGNEYDSPHQAALALVLSRGFTLNDFLLLLHSENHLLNYSWDIYDRYLPFIMPPDVIALVQGEPQPLQSAWMEMRGDRLETFGFYDDPAVGPVTCRGETVNLLTTAFQLQETVIASWSDPQLPVSSVGEPAYAPQSYDPRIYAQPQRFQAQQPYAPAYSRPYAQQGYTQEPVYEAQQPYIQQPYPQRPYAQQPAPRQSGTQIQPYGRR